MSFCNSTYVYLFVLWACYANENGEVKGADRTGNGNKVLDNEGVHRKDVLDSMVNEK